MKTNKNSPSLNQAAYSGIDLMTSLLKMLLMFRTNKYVMISDVKQAFLMIKLKEESDKNRFCFFWQENGKLVTYRYTSLVFGFTSSPFILHYVMQHHVSKYPDDKCTQILLNNFYVDNLIITGNDLDELKTIYKTSYDRMSDGGFILRSWNSNSEDLNELFTDDLNMAEHGCDEEKLLGYRYNLSNDTIHVAKVDLNSKANTKREVLSGISKIFDPLSLVLPITIKGRILMRKIWSSNLKLQWDDVLPTDLSAEWEKLSIDFANIFDISFDRATLNEDLSYGLHIFCDSSQTSFGFVMYGTHLDESNFLFAKAKIAPMKNYSIPTLELMSVVLAFKCLPEVLSAYDNIKFEFVNIIVDAQVVLSWLLSDELKTKSKFVKNRLKEVQCAKVEILDKFKLKTHFNYVNTNENPADMITRGISSKKFKENLQFWIHGPQWLSNDFEKWPKHQLLSLAPDVKKLTLVNMNLNNSCVEQEIEQNCIIDIKSYSSLNKLLRVTSYVFKFYQKTLKLNINPDDYATTFWIKQMQKECFSKEIEFLQQGKNENIPSLVNNLNLFLDATGILRTRGRISKSIFFYYKVQTPILLGKDHHLTKLLIVDAHNRVQHLGLQTTLNLIRNAGYWIPKARQSVKKAISDCIICKKFNAFAFNYPKFTNMPKHHLNLIKPFLHVGVDYTGHMWVKNTETNKNTKMYILIFTCLNVRAIHLELLPDMSSKKFLLAFQRFCNLYLIPTHLYSDNAKTFIQGGELLNQSLASEEIIEHLRANNIQHVRIPLYSAWVGAAWERLIRVVKSCLYKIVGRARLTYFELLTTLSNIQNAVNSRPLTYRSSENELDIISPNSFLKLHSNASLIIRSPDEDVWVDDESQERLNRTLEVQEETFEEFRKMWHECYLISLREHSKNLYQNDWTNRIKVNDIVLIKQPNKPRPFWLLGKVLEIVMGFDSKIRSVKLKQGNGQIAHHSICHLFPLELSITHSGNTQNTQQNEIEIENSIEQNEKIEATCEEDQQSKRPQRKAALKFKQFMKGNLSNL